MASGMYSTGLKNCLDGTIDIDTSVLKLMLIDSGYTFNPDEDVVSTALTAAELSCTNYTGGFGDAARKTVTVTLQSNDTDNRVDIAIGTPVTWTALGGAANDTIGGAALIFETGGADTASVPIAFFDINPDVPTNGSDVSLTFNALGSGGNIRISV